VSGGVACAPRAKHDRVIGRLPPPRPGAVTPHGVRGSASFGRMNVPEDPFAAAARELEARVRAHEQTRSTKRYEDAVVHLRRLVQDFAIALRASWLAFTRYPESRHWLLQNSTDDLLESVAAVPALTREGIFNVARRELRYLLEATVKYVYVDQQLASDASLEDRIRLLSDNTKVPRSSIRPID
jgi:hypothetical protein